ncbi:hypothetical protein GH5_03125 [Leishmania sp. Ghana 2012 LV757]|uniref:hypothetical protein n=1 Tax=Leishmania sp. Ghana 2012 LV757 TaxID=2803181 RepID=UPI001B4578BB|nr:hypothetical protein GH5_03125 [Leishmania sp. Ghana 2012 LV757]
MCVCVCISLRWRTPFTVVFPHFTYRVWAHSHSGTLPLPLLSPDRDKPLRLLIPFFSGLPTSAVWRARITHVTVSAIVDKRYASAVTNTVRQVRRNAQGEESQQLTDSGGERRSSDIAKGVLGTPLRHIIRNLTRTIVFFFFLHMHCCFIRRGVPQKTLNSPAGKCVKRTVDGASGGANPHRKNVLPPPLQREGQQLTTGAVFLCVNSTAASMGAVDGTQWTRHLFQRDGAATTVREGAKECRSEIDDTGAAGQTGLVDASDVLLLPETGEAATKLPLTGEQAIVCGLACQGASLFVGGEAGTGKSHLLRSIAESLTAQGRRIAVTASTGIAALNIGGNTFHSTFGVPPPSPDDVMDISAGPPSSEASVEDADVSADGSEEGEVVEEDVAGESFVAGPSVDKLGRYRRLQFRNTGVLAEVDVVIIDEVSMLHAGVLESFERAARRMPGRDATRPFGGLQMILSGDFMQLTPFAAADVPFGRLRRHRTLDEQNKLRKDLDSVVCQRVSPDDDDAQAPRYEVASLADPVAKACDSPGAVAACEAESASAAKQGKSGRVFRVSHSSATKGRRRDLWYYDKPMFESWCFIHHLLHVQLREPLRQQDSKFAAALNHLRAGRLPYRLSRSAFLNAPVEDAVRLLPTKAAVKNYNDRKMLELEGDEQLFQTRLTMTEAMCASSLINETDNGSEVEARGMREATLLVHYRLCSPIGSASVALKRRGRLRDVEAIAVARSLEEICRFPRGTVQVHGLPSPLSYSASLSAVCVRCRGATGRIAQGRRSAVKNLLEMCCCVPGTGNQKPTPGDVESASKHASVLTRLKPLGALFPRELVRVEALEARQLMRRLQPLMQENLRDAVRKDTVLQDKRLKVGCRVMLLRNLTHKYVNGSLGTVLGFRSLATCTDLLPGEMKAHATPARLLARAPVGAAGSGHGAAVDLVQVPVVRMDAEGKAVAIPWITLPVSVAKHDWCFTLCAACMPLTPAYAFTVHKVQGVTLDYAVLFDADGMFPCDHLVYVAASRVRQFEHLRMVNLSPQMISVHKPSLLFTQKIPTVEAAAKMWASWKSKSGAGPGFYIPSHLAREPPG